MSAIKQFVQNLLSAEQDTEEEQDPFDLEIQERSDYPTDEQGIPRVPEEDLIGVFPRDSTWGNKIQWSGDFDDNDRGVHGWMTVRDRAVVPDQSFERPVQDGDLFGWEMASGEIGVFRLIGVENQSDPKDMFFATALDIGYVEQ